MYKIEPDSSEKFEFEAMDGKVYSVPYPNHLRLKIITKYNHDVSKAKTDEQRQNLMIDFVTGIFDEHAPGSTDDLTTTQFLDLATAYMDGANGAGEA